MTIDTKTIVSVTEVNQNFSRVTRIAEKNGQAVIFQEQQTQIYAGGSGCVPHDRYDR